jgi:hypothetical protein
MLHSGSDDPMARSASQPPLLPPKGSQGDGLPDMYLARAFLSREGTCAIPEGAAGDRECVDIFDKKGAGILDNLW